MTHYVFGQKLEVLGVTEVKSDSINRVQTRYDINKEPCAVLIVEADTIANMDFSGNIIGKVELLNSSKYLMHIAKGTKRIKCRHEDFHPTTIDFTEFNISVVGGKYYLTKIRPAAEVNQTSSDMTLRYLIFKSNIPLEKVVVNGQNWPVIGNMSRKMLRTGHYEYTVKALGNKVRKGIVDISEDKNKIINIDFE